MAECLSGTNGARRAKRKEGLRNEEIYSGFASPSIQRTMEAPGRMGFSVDTGLLEICINDI